MTNGSDIILTCRQCGKSFVFTEAEQEFFKEKGFTQPRRCKDCRSGNGTHTHPHLVCAQCGNELSDNVSAYCFACLATAELDSELKSKQAQQAANEAFARLKTIEAEKAELEEILHQKTQVLQDLEKDVVSLNKELEEERELYANLNRWFQPTINAMEKRVEQRLEDLEQGQNKINERIRQLLERLLDAYENTTLGDVIKRTFRSNQKSTSQVVSR